MCQQGEQETHLGPSTFSWDNEAPRAQFDFARDSWDEKNKEQGPAGQRCVHERIKHMKQFEAHIAHLTHPAHQAHQAHLSI